MINNLNFNDPNAYAQSYADKNGISLEEAKAELKAKYGDPSKNGAGAPTETTQGELFASATDENSLVDVDTSFTFDDDSEDVVEIYDLNDSQQPTQSVDKEAIVNALVKKAGISETEAKDALSALGLDKGADKVDPEVKLQAFAEATGLSTSDAKEFLKTYVGEPQKQ